MNEETYHEDLEASENMEETEEEKGKRLYKEAKEKIDQWLSEKKVSKRKRREHSDSIETLAEEMAEGNLRFDEEGRFIQALKFPFEKVSELRYKKRITKEEVDSYLKGVDPRDGEGRVVAYISALTNMPRTMIKQLDSEDLDIPNSIVVFFIA